MIFYCFLLQKYLLNNNDSGKKNWPQMTRCLVFVLYFNTCGKLIGRKTFVVFISKKEMQWTHDCIKIFIGFHLNNFRFALDLQSSLFLVGFGREFISNQYVTNKLTNRIQISSNLSYWLIWTSWPKTYLANKCLVLICFESGVLCEGC